MEAETNLRNTEQEKTESQDFTIPVTSSEPSVKTKVKVIKITESDFENFHDLLSYIIENQKFLTKLSVSKFLKLKEISDLNLSSFDPLIQDFWKKDKTLNVATSLIKDISLSGSATPAKTQVCDLMEQVILAHPIFNKKKEESKDLCSFDSNSIDAYTRGLSTHDLGLDELATVTPLFKKTLKNNVFTSILLLNVFRGVWTSKEAIDYAGQSIWGKSEGSSDLAVEKVITSKDSRALGAVHRRFHRDLERLSLVNTNLNSENEELKRSVVALEGTLNESEQRETRLAVELETLVKQMKTMEDEHSLEKSILLDNMLAQKTEALTTYGEIRIDLEKLQRDLNSALHAINNGKSEYAIDFLQNNVKLISDYIAKLKIREKK